ncbi:hypothetical protein CEB3_c19570 [Peptococcaceae bacterium CEB3]|nr:hypothetical protein CEB3_c19570 [Peptococcaceae bacterium CEB3]
MKKKITVILATLFFVLGVAVPMAAQIQVDRAVRSVIIQGIEFDPSTQTFVYTLPTAEAQRLLAQKLGPLGATVKVKITKHGFFGLAHWPLLGDFGSEGTFAAKNVATGKAMYPK